MLRPSECKPKLPVYEDCCCLSDGTLQPHRKLSQRHTVACTCSDQNVKLKLWSTFLFKPS